MKRYFLTIFPASLACVSSLLLLLTVFLTVPPHYPAFATSGTGLHLPLAEATAGAIIVTNTLNDGAGSLRAAITAANPGDTIIFDASLSGSTITLSSQLAIAKHLTIDGSALPISITLSGNHAVRILFISSGAHVTLNRLRFSAGAVDDLNEGGGLYIASGAVVTLTHSAVLSCTAGWGGGIANVMGALTVQNSTFAGNSANYGGGIASVMGALTVQNSTFAGNSAGSNGGGIHSLGGGHADGAEQHLRRQLGHRFWRRPLQRGKHADGTGQHVLRQFGLGGRRPLQLPGYADGAEQHVRRKRGLPGRRPL